MYHILVCKLNVFCNNLRAERGIFFRVARPPHHQYLKRSFAYGYVTLPETNNVDWSYISKYIYTGLPIDGYKVNIHTGLPNDGFNFNVCLMITLYIKKLRQTLKSVYP